MVHIVLGYLDIFVGLKLLLIIQWIYHVVYYVIQVLIHRVSFWKLIEIWIINFVLEFFSRYCLPTGNWSHFNLASCFYPDILALLNQSYTRRPLEEREVCEFVFKLFIFFLKKGFRKNNSSSSLCWIRWIINLINKYSYITFYIFYF
jgi:hypothetical protein